MPVEAGETTHRKRGVVVEIFRDNARNIERCPPELYRSFARLLNEHHDKAAKSLAVKWDDELVKATALTRDGAVITVMDTRLS